MYYIKSNTYKKIHCSTKTLFSPDSRGAVAEFDWVPYQNTKLSLQYTLYDKFNGGSTNYDGMNRSASDNNTLYILGWLNF